MNISFEYYKKNIIPQFITQQISKNVMEVPKLLKIVINTGFSVADSNKKNIEDILHDLSLIAGQKAIITKAKKSIAGFKLRKSFIIGCKVTLRKKNMYNFLHKLISLVLPRLRDFRGLPGKSFDGHGNYSFGIKEHIIFPEIDYDKITNMKGFDICIVTNAKNNEKARLLLKAFNFPIN